MDKNAMQNNISKCEFIVGRQSCSVEVLARTPRSTRKVVDYRYQKALRFISGATLVRRMHV